MGVMKFHCNERRGWERKGGKESREKIEHKEMEEKKGKKQSVNMRERI